MPTLAAIDTALVVALISGCVSLAVAVFTRRTALRLAELEGEREEQRARRDYEYEARKRLYKECAPLMFQAAELATPARSRVTSLARTARGGNARPDGSGWLAGEGYYFLSTTYMLLAPATTFRLLQRRLTVIDLSLEPGMRSQYELLKLVFLSFNEDFELARQAPELTYKPDKTDPAEPDRDRLLMQSPEHYARQGLYRGVLDVVIEALIVEDGAGGQRVMSFGEFLRDWERPDSRLDGVRGILRELILGFHPARKPVLWRVLLVQHMLYTVLLRDEPVSHPLPPPSPEDLQAFDWRRETDTASDEEIRAPALAAHAYVSAKLADVAARMQAPTAA